MSPLLVGCLDMLKLDRLKGGNTFNVQESGGVSALHRNICIIGITLVNQGRNGKELAA